MLSVDKDLTERGGIVKTECHFPFGGGEFFMERFKGLGKETQGSEIFFFDHAAAQGFEFFKGSFPGIAVFSVLIIELFEGHGIKFPASFDQMTVVAAVDADLIIRK